MFSEKDFEDILVQYPELIEPNLKLLGRQVRYFGKSIDILFEDRFKEKLIVELKKDNLTRDALSQVLEYEGYILSEKDPTARVMLIANRIPLNLKKAMEHHGIEFKELTVRFLMEFLEKKGENLTQNIEPEIKMTNEINSKAVEILVTKGLKLIDTPYEFINLSKVVEIDKYLNDLENYPHMFVLACLMDIQMKAEKAWKIPYLVSQEIGNHDFSGLLKLELNDLQEIFVTRKLHRFNLKMAGVYFEAIQKLNSEYKGVASKIWTDDFSCGTILKRFREFKGAGEKTATMATNILLRLFKIPLKDRFLLNISPDVNVRRVFTRLGFIDKNSSNEELQNFAKKLYPEYPGVFDSPTWHIGQKWCRTEPDCSQCELTTYCKKRI